jgi:hypothetical protein
MSVKFEIPEWLGEQPAAPLPPVDDHRVEGLVNRFITAKQESLFTAPDAFYRREGGDAVAGASRRCETGPHSVHTCRSFPP